MSESSDGYESTKETAVKLKELGNLAYKEKRFDEALAYYKKAISLNPTEISFYNNIAAVYIEEEEYELAKEECNKAFEIGQAHEACSFDLSRSVARMGKALWKLGDLYNAMWKYEEALSLNSTESVGKDLEKVYGYVKVSLSKSDDLSEEKILAAGDMIKRIYVNHDTKYQTVYENPILFPRAPQQIFVDAFSEADSSHPSIRRQEAQLQYDAEVDLYRALESLELSKKIIVLHSFKFSKSQACLFSGSEESSDGEHDFVVIVRDYAIVLIEVKSPLNITNKTFKRNLNDSRRQLGRAKSLIMNICNIWNINQSAVDVLEYTAFPKAYKENVIDFPSYKSLAARKIAVSGILFQEDVQNFGSWWKDNITAYLDKVCMERTKSPKGIHRLTSTLVGIWCVNQKDVCDIEICSLGHCVKEIDDAVRSAEITQNKLKPVSKGVKTSPKIIKTYFGVECLTESQETVFNDDKVAQFIMGPAGSGKTILLLGKMIQVFQKPESGNIGTSRRKYLFITGTFELDALADLLKKAGMNAIISHIVAGWVDGTTFRLEKNDHFHKAFYDSQCTDFDAFILHHSALLDPIFWQQSNQTDDSIQYVLMNLINNEDNHIFIDDFHNALDNILGYVTEKAAPDYIKDYPKTLLHEIVTAMRERSTKNANSNEIDSRPPRFWLTYDHSQMTLSLNKKDVDLSGDGSCFRRMITYVRDFELALKIEVECDKTNSIPVFRSLTRNLRNTVDISRCIENFYIDNSKFNSNIMGSTKGRIFDRLKLPKLFQETGHLIHGPKPIFFLVKNSDHQEQVVDAIILDVLEELLKDGILCPKDILIVTDSYLTFHSRQFGNVLMDKMFLLKLHGYDGVTVRVTEDKDTIQATEWKAVIHLTDLFECTKGLQGQPKYLNDLPQTLRRNDKSSYNYNDAKSLLKTYMTLSFSPMYVTMSRARVYLVVIGKIGNFERKQLWEMQERFGLRKHTRAERDRFRLLPDDVSQMTVSEEGEYASYRKSNFVYKTVPDSQEHAVLPRLDDG